MFIALLQCEIYTSFKWLWRNDGICNNKGSSDHDSNGESEKKPERTVFAEGNKKATIIYTRSCNKTIVIKRNSSSLHELCKNKIKQNKKKNETRNSNEDFFINSFAIKCDNTSKTFHTNENDMAHDECALGALREKFREQRNDVNWFSCAWG